MVSNIETDGTMTSAWEEVKKERNKQKHSLPIWRCTPANARIPTRSLATVSLSRKSLLGAAHSLGEVVRGCKCSVLLLCRPLQSQSRCRMVGLTLAVHVLKTTCNVCFFFFCRLHIYRTVVLFSVSGSPSFEHNLCQCGSSAHLAFNTCAPL